MCLQERGSDERAAGRRARPRLVSAAVSLVSARAAEIAAAMAAIALYLPSLEYGFVFDDAALISQGAPVPLGGGIPYRPLRYASYLVDAWLGGTPAVYHAHNVLLHGLVAALVVALARRLGSTRAAALAGGLLVACHPYAVESAAYVAGRRDLLCVAFGLGSLMAHLSGRLGLAVALVAASVSAKESGLLFVAPLAAASLAGVGDAARLLSNGRSIAVFATVLAATGAAWAVAYGAIGPWTPASGLAGLAFAGQVAWHYATGLVALRPFAAEYPELLRQAAGSDATAMPGGIAAASALLLAATGAVLACAQARRRGLEPVIVFALAWAASTLVAVSLWGGLHEPGADRHGYLLLAPVAALVSLFVSRAVRGGAAARIAALATATLVIASLATLTSTQMQVWRSEASLWSHAASRPGASSRAHLNFARVLAGQGDYSGAAGHMGMAVVRDPSDPQLYLARAAVRCAQGRRLMARRDLRTAGRFGAARADVAGLARECPLRVFAASPEPAA